MEQEELTGNTLLITGGTGSLGNAIVSKLLHDYNDIQFDKIIIYSRDEQKQEVMKNKFITNPSFHKLRFFIGDIRDKERLALAMRKVTHVIHAAAMKIVPTVEYNPFEAVKTNIIGTQNLIDVCENSNCIQKILFISTDKAVSPINLYGATKLAAEKLIIAANAINKDRGPKYSVARYGNVANSNGSVIPYFKSLLEKGLNIPITSPDMTRFWITLENAATFVLDRLLGMNGEEIFIPDMKSFKISDLASILLENNSNLCKGCGEPEICHIGIRPGEKIHEAIVSKHEFENVTDEKEYFIILNRDRIPNIHVEQAYILKKAFKLVDDYSSYMNLMNEEELYTTLVEEKIIPGKYSESYANVEKPQLAATL